MIDPDDTQYESWPWLNWSIVLVFVGAILMIGLISAGVFDPKPLGQLSDTLPLQPLDLATGETTLTWLAPAAPDTDHTLRLTAALDQGELDSAYGLAIGDDVERIVVAVAPTGYVSIWQDAVNDQQPLIRWRTWPHVAQNDGMNELWLNIEAGQLTEVRINRELLWQGAQPVPGRRIGLWAESYGDRARIDFRDLEVFTAGQTG